MRCSRDLDNGTEVSPCPLLIIKATTHTLTRPEKVISERECDKASERQHKEREELTLMGRKRVSQATSTIKNHMGHLPVHRKCSL